PTPEFPDRLELIGEQVLQPGEIISFMPDAIHSVESLGDEPTISFNIYGKTNYPQRFEFDNINHTAKNF
ncbi:MAG: cupin, partial [Waterburya sp.]